MELIRSDNDNFNDCETIKTFFMYSWIFRFCTLPRPSNFQARILGNRYRRACSCRLNQSWTFSISVCQLASRSFCWRVDVVKTLWRTSSAKFEEEATATRARWVSVFQYEQFACRSLWLSQTRLHITLTTHTSHRLDPFQEAIVAFA